MQRVASVKLVVVPDDGSAPNHRQWSWIILTALVLAAIVAAGIAVYVITARRKSSSEPR
jgi:hypothetical protein